MSFSSITRPAMLLALLALATGAGAQSAARPAATSRPAPATPFAKTVLPIFRTACIGCHGGPEPAGKLALTSYAGLIHGGASGPALIAGKSRDSRMVKMLLGTLQPQMPPGGGMKPTDITAIRKWIDSGASPDPTSTDTAAPVTPISTHTALPHASAASHTRAVATPVTAIAFHPAGKLLAVGSYEQVSFWDTDSGKCVSTWTGLPGAVRALSFSRDGKWLAAGAGVPAGEGEIRIWDMTVGKEASGLKGHTDTVTALAYSPDGKLLVSGSMDKSLCVWETKTGKLLHTLRDHADAVWGVAFSPDGKYMATCSGDRSVKVWNPITGERLYSVDAHDDVIYAVAFSPDGKTFVSASADKTLKEWGFGVDGAAAIRTLSGHEAPVLTVAYSPDGKTIASASADKSVRLWNASNGGLIRALTGERDWVYAVAFSQDGKTLAAGSWDGRALTWHMPDGAPALQLSDTQTAASR